MFSLYIVSTPIGNMGDITLRAVEVLKEVDYILSEDTRETAKILQKFNINTPQISYRDQNHKKILPRILSELKNGKKLALVSDSGTPLISDPGFKLVYELRKNGIEIISIPGPSSVIAALSISGLPTDKFTFVGFLPKKKSARKAIIEKYGNLDCTLTIFESPYRVKGLIREIFAILGDRKACIVKDLTKTYEKVLYGSLSEIISNENEIKEKGEYIVMIAKENYKNG